MGPRAETRLKHGKVSIDTQILFCKLEKIGDNCIYFRPWYDLEMVFQRLVMFKMRKIKFMPVRWSTGGSLMVLYHLENFIFGIISL